MQPQLGAGGAGLPGQARVQLAPGPTASQSSASTPRITIAMFPGSYSAGFDGNGRSWPGSGAGRGAQGEGRKVIWPARWTG
jgi:hypothetical protein